MPCSHKASKIIMKQFSAVLGVALVLLLAGCCTTHRSTRWEYKTVSSETDVNRLAGEGWVVAGFSTYFDTIAKRDYEQFLLKRPRQ